VDSRSKGVDSRSEGVDLRSERADSRSEGVDSRSERADSRSEGVDCHDVVVWVRQVKNRTTGVPTLVCPTYERVEQRLLVKYR